MNYLNQSIFNNWKFNVHFKKSINFFLPMLKLVLNPLHFSLLSCDPHFQTSQKVSENIYYKYTFKMEQITTKIPAIGIGFNSWK